MALVTVPFLTFMLPSLGFSTEVSPLIALASSMVIAAIGSISSLRVHQQKGTINWGLIQVDVTGQFIWRCAWLLAGNTFASFVAAVHFCRFFVLCGFLYVKAISKILLSCKKHPQLNWLRWFPALVGFTGSFIGAGGGVLMVPFLSRFMAMPKAVASSVAVGFPVTVFGAISYMLQTAPVSHPDLIWCCVLACSAWNEYRLCGSSSAWCAARH